MSLLRTPKDDEGCDVECKYCPRHLLTGRCSCGYVRQCDGCQTTEGLKLFWNEGPVFLCGPCADYAFDNQLFDARTP